MSLSGAAVLALALFVTPGAAWSAPAEDGFARVGRPFLQGYCVRCHNAQEAEGDLVLSTYMRGAELLRDAQVWDHVMERVELAEMPPKESSQPTPQERAAFLSWLAAELAPSDPDAPVDPGRPGLRRLNADEYRRTVRDVLGVDFQAREHFPRDSSAFGFETVGEALTLSDLTVECYLRAAEEIAAQAVAVDDSAAPPERRYQGADLSGTEVRGVKVLSRRGDVGVPVEFARTSRYTLRVASVARQAGPELARVGLVLGTRVLQEFEVRAQPGDELEVHELTVDIPAGRRRVAARFPNDYFKPEHPDPAQRDRNLYVGWIEVVGPLDPPPLSAFQAELRERFGTRRGPAAERALLGHLVRRVWRREPRQGDLERLLDLPPAGARADERLCLQLTAMLVSPHFLFRLEHDPPAAAAGDVRALTDQELVVRLSYFLWGTAPDEALARRARRDDLSDPGTYEVLVREMLQDPRSRAFSEDFCGQWLKLRALDEWRPDTQLFPSWNEDLKRAMCAESVGFFDAVLRDGLSVLELLEADWTLANETLAEIYGLEGVQGPDLRRVSLAATARRGVLGQAGVLALTSEPGRTSPVRRGKWVLEVILNAQPPDSPVLPNPLDERPEAVSGRSLRERWEAHRADPSCAACHDLMDPLGFGLENYDVLGSWRDSYGEFQVDASGQLPDGRAFEGPQGLSRALQQDGRFLRGLTEKLLIYSVGRGLTREDRRAVEHILGRLDPSTPRLAELVVAVACSRPFTHRRVGEP